MALATCKGAATRTSAAPKLLSNMILLQVGKNAWSHSFAWFLHRACDKNLQLFVSFKWSSKRNSLTTHLGMVICTHYLAGSSKLTQGHFLQTLTSFRKCHFKDHVCLDKSFLDGTVFALAFFELWERTNWHPVSNTQRLNFPYLWK